MRAWLADTNCCRSLKPPAALMTSDAWQLRLRITRQFFVGVQLFLHRAQRSCWHLRCGDSAPQARPSRRGERPSPSPQEPGFGAGAAAGFADAIGAGFGDAGAAFAVAAGAGFGVDGAAFAAAHRLRRCGRCRRLRHRRLSPQPLPARDSASRDGPVRRSGRARRRCSRGRRRCHGRLGRGAGAVAGFACAVCLAAAACRCAAASAACLSAADSLRTAAFFCSSALLRGRRFLLRGCRLLRGWLRRRRLRAEQRSRHHQQHHTSREQLPLHSSPPHRAIRQAANGKGRSTRHSTRSALKCPERHRRQRRDAPRRLIGRRRWSGL